MWGGILVIKTVLTLKIYDLHSAYTCLAAHRSRGHHPILSPENVAASTRNVDIYCIGESRTSDCTYNSLGLNEDDVVYDVHFK